MIGMMLGFFFKKSHLYLIWLNLFVDDYHGQHHKLKRKKNTKKTKFKSDFLATNTFNLPKNN
jgi:hypothetical protein